LTSDSSAIDGIPFLLIARCPSPDARALFIRGRSNGNLKSLPAGRSPAEPPSSEPGYLEGCPDCVEIFSST
jgi:hypothetical protein